MVDIEYFQIDLFVIANHNAAASRLLPMCAVDMHYTFTFAKQYFVCGS